MYNIYGSTSNKKGKFSFLIYHAKEECPSCTTQIKVRQRIPRMSVLTFTLSFFKPLKFPLEIFHFSFLLFFNFRPASIIDQGRWHVGI